jgi:hypothetical protein
MTGLPDGAAVVHQFAVERQRDMKHLVKASLLVTTALRPVALASQTLVR